MADGRLADSQGNVLKTYPDNRARPPAHQLCYRALPAYGPGGSHHKVGKNVPIPIQDEQELSRLFIQEFYKKGSDCTISKLDTSAIFLILKNADCFPDIPDVSNRSEKLREIRNQWAHGVMSEWDSATFSSTFSEIESFAKLLQPAIPTTFTQLLSELKENRTDQTKLFNIQRVLDEADKVKSATDIV